eukprot:jgi/Galph1/1703/GphlegSOOS_G377.1
MSNKNLSVGFLCAPVRIKQRLKLSCPHHYSGFYCIGNWPCRRLQELKPSKLYLFQKPCGYFHQWKVATPVYPYLRYALMASADNPQKSESENLDRETSTKLPSRKWKASKTSTFPSSELKPQLDSDVSEESIVAALKQANPKEACRQFFASENLVITTKTLNQLLQGLGNSRFGLDMLRVYEEAIRRGTKLSILTFTILLSRIKCIAKWKRQETVNILHKKLLEFEGQIVVDIRTMNSLIYAYCQADLVDNALQVYKNLRKDYRLEPTEITLNILCKGLVQSKRYSEALELFSVEMPCVGITPSMMTYSIIFEAFGRLGKLDQMTQLWNQMLARGHQPTDAVYFSAMYACAIHNDLKAMFDYYRDMIQKGIRPNIRIYGMIINALGKAGKLELAFGWLQKMTEEGIAPNEYIYTSLIDACGNVGDMDLALSVYDCMQRSGLPCNIVTMSALLHGCCKNEYPMEAMNVFRKMESLRYRLSKSQFHELLLCMGHFKLIDESLEIFKALKYQYNTVSESDLYCLLWTFAFSSIDSCASLVFQAMKVNDEESTFRTYALYLHSQRKEPNFALEWGTAMMERIKSFPNIFLIEFYHILLHISSLDGNTEKFFSLLDEMINNQSIDGRTLTVIIDGLCRLDWKDEETDKKMDIAMICCNALLNLTMDEFFCHLLSPTTTNFREPYAEQLSWHFMDRLQAILFQVKNNKMSISDALMAILNACNLENIPVDRMGKTKVGGRYWNVLTNQVPLSIVAYNAILWKYTRCRQYPQAKALFERMEKDLVPNNLITFAIMTAWCIAQDHLDGAEEMIQLAKQNQVADSIELYNILLSGYRNEGKLEKILQMFHHIRSEVSLDIVTYRVMIESCYQQKDRIKALAVLRHMKEANFSFSWETKELLSNICYENGYTEDGDWWKQQAAQCKTEYQEKERCRLETLQSLFFNTFRNM